MGELLSGSTFDYLILDLHESDLHETGSSSHTVHAILDACPGICMLVIGPQVNDDLAMEMISAGARAYLDLNSEIDTVRVAIDAVVSGSICAPRRVLSKLIDRLLKVSDSSLTDAPPRLTSREKQVIERIMLARSTREIARELGIGIPAVTAHIGRLLRKTGTDNRLSLASYMRRRKWSDDSGDSGNFSPSHTGLIETD
jgi:DNA-binding NarL/FixJ family response regulator